MPYLIIAIITFLLSVIFTLAVKTIAIQLKILDYPDGERKIHKTPIPLLGGVAVFLSFILVLAYYSFFTNLVIWGFILPKHILGIILASFIIILGGVLDDKYNLKPKIQFIFPLLATLIIIISGIGINHVRNPFGGIISFENWDIILFWWQGIPYKITLLADLFTLIWLLGMMYTTKLLDGLDGLVSGITVIGSLIIFGISMSNNVAQYNTGLIALILAGAFCGFLIFNFQPAKIFLGESGSLFAGLMLGVLAIISGSKVATTLLIMGIPINMETLKTEKKSNNVLFAVIFLAVIIIIVIVIIKPFSIYSIYEPLSKGKVIINGQTISVEIAKTPEQQEEGLKGRTKVNDDQGMLFVFKDKRYYNFWMDGMKIPIDIIWLDDNKIIDITKNAPVPTDPKNPAIFRPASEVNYVLEVRAGSSRFSPSLFLISRKLESLKFIKLNF
ncbi:MAG: DUF192 domain-containing protein [Candidatus Parcubacteria bacterium]|nr:DUF192 domain-containing protein [Candidatus Parcubacteria bacterium]